MPSIPARCVDGDHAAIVTNRVNKSLSDGRTLNRTGGHISCR
jgi:hypothetical protein